MSARYRVYEGVGHLFEAANVEFELDQGRLRVARLTTDAVDQLPIPVDEDADSEIDPLDHCDNSLRGLAVNPYGCHEPAAMPKIELELPNQNSPPELQDDEFEIETNGILVITPAQLLANDSDADSDLLEIVDVSQPEVGRLAFNQNSNLVYRPVEGFTGLDFFKYTVIDNNGGAATATATVTIKVREPEIVSLSKLQLVNFIYDEAELTEVSKAKVAAIIEQIKLAKNITIEIYTYTDNIGSDGYNEALSAHRARALEELLVSNGIDRGDIKAVGMGEKNPIADNSTEAGQAINRRGEFIFKAKSAAE